jgi:hypothetical protein
MCKPKDECPELNPVVENNEQNETGNNQENQTESSQEEESASTSAQEEE